MKIRLLYNQSHLFLIGLFYHYILIDIHEIKEIPMTTVLVIDDSPSEMAKFRDMLSKNNYHVLEASNGEQGCQMAADHLPDVILMDVVMPEMNGFQATRKITRGKTTSHIPIIIISTKNQETDRVWGKRQGAKEYITKPIDESGLVQIIRKVMG